MRTFDDIYNDFVIKNNPEFKYTFKELLQIFEREQSWLGHPLQLIRLREIQTEITGIRPGNCSGCNIEVLVNMVRWINRYEKEQKEKHDTNSNGGLRHRRKSKK